MLPIQYEVLGLTTFKIIYCAKSTFSRKLTENGFLTRSLYLASQLFICRNPILIRKLFISKHSSLMSLSYLFNFRYDKFYSYLKNVVRTWLCFQTTEKRQQTYDWCKDRKLDSIIYFRQFVG